MKRFMWMSCTLAILALVIGCGYNEKTDKPKDGGTKTNGDEMNGDEKNGDEKNGDGNNDDAGRDGRSFEQGDPKCYAGPGVCRTECDAAGRLDTNRNLTSVFRRF